MTLTESFRGLSGVEANFPPPILFLGADNGKTGTFRGLRGTPDVFTVNCWMGGGGKLSLVSLSSSSLDEDTVRGPEGPRFPPVMRGTGGGWGWNGYGNEVILFD